VTDASVGCVVPTKRPDLLANAMLDVMRLDPPARIAMGAAARSIVASKFDLDAVVTRWEETYRDTLASRVAKNGGVGDSGRQR
jgi:glycosyltransferase involved in cell wall biosynthesis